MSEEDSPQPGFAWGGPLATGQIRVEPEDFVVSEELGHQPDGEGEHLWLWVIKRERNTVDVAADLARAAGVHIRQVGFAGLKDRNAVTRQYFSIHLPGTDSPDWSAWSIHGVTIESASRSSRKIKRGRLRGNRFELIVRDVDGDRAALEQRLIAARDHGVPNGFGEQRFGGNNIARARALFRGELRRKPSKIKRGFYLSAARSLVFNHVLIERLRRGDWNRLIDGDLAMLDGSRSFFEADADDPEQVRRCAELDIHPSGPLSGQGDSPAGGEAAELENRMFDAHHELVEGLAKFGMKQERRPLRMRVGELEWDFLDDRTLKLAFSLGTGSYATSVLRELVDYDSG
ncbi:MULTISPECIES: tRNA pseudouridine(13) synthase TruD [unclassified Wenzhouxiangella]|uniref:tRNA pseudouridine(13) synthase TruD n=1 Tax=unclassified Wenzhouxiangella TaxID=2613841 RepID=UPI000E326CD5|nr:MULTISPECIES: tRNA pseudouridine(13) synthase TruD [unclassified Wenzhouxiangella]RFF27593.1 tRNA pseudouridine(13) synthase TruD [Wenzhouxiangella sp. 15181]RFP70118.1 tRNA pseudouridine(13) synthase TruD [Wenzhouxiangella sp. 15190]